MDKDRRDSLIRKMCAQHGFEIDELEAMYPDDAALEAAAREFQGAAEIGNSEDICETEWDNDKYAPSAKEKEQIEKVREKVRSKKRESQQAVEAISGPTAEEPKSYRDRLDAIGRGINALSAGDEAVESDVDDDGDGDDDEKDND